MAQIKKRPLDVRRNTYAGISDTLRDAKSADRRGDVAELRRLATELNAYAAALVEHVAEHGASFYSSTATKARG